MLKQIEAMVYKKVEEKYWVKLKVGDMYISGITVQPSPHFPEKGLWVQMPGFKADGKYKKYIEFPKTSPTREAFEKACLAAVASWSEKPSDEEVENFDWDNVSI